MKAYKVFDKDMTCKGIQYKVGKTYTMKDDPIICKIGFHACGNLADCFNYYSFDPENKVAEVMILGKIAYDENKSKLCTNKLKVKKLLAWEEVMRLANSGDWNSGHRNSGNRNSGDLNTNCPDKYRVFNKWIKKDVYDSISFPSFFIFDVTVFIGHDIASEKEKADHKKEFDTNGGYSKTLSYKEAWKLSWTKADIEDRKKVKKIPGFDNDLFLEISGINVNEELK